MTPYFTEFLRFADDYNGAPAAGAVLSKRTIRPIFSIGQMAGDFGGPVLRMNAYGDEPSTAGTREGALAGDAIHSRSMAKRDRRGRVTNTWTDKALKQVRLDAAGTIAISGCGVPDRYSGPPR